MAVDWNAFLMGRPPSAAAPPPELTAEPAAPLPPDPPPPPADVPRGTMPDPLALPPVELPPPVSVADDPNAAIRPVTSDHYAKMWDENPAKVVPAHAFNSAANEFFSFLADTLRSVEGGMVAGTDATDVGKYATYGSPLAPILAPAAMARRLAPGPYAAAGKAVGQAADAFQLVTDKAFPGDPMLRGDLVADTIPRVGGMVGQVVAGGWATGGGQTAARLSAIERAGQKMIAKGWNPAQVQRLEQVASKGSVETLTKMHRSVMAAQGAVIQGSRAYEQAKAALAPRTDLTDEEKEARAGASFWMNAGLGTANAVSVARIVSRFFNGNPATWMTTITNAFVETGENVFVGDVQMMGENAFAQVLYDQNRKLWDGLAETTATNGVVALLASLVTSAVHAPAVRAQAAKMAEKAKALHKNEVGAMGDQPPKDLLGQDVPGKEVQGSLLEDASGRPKVGPMAKRMLGEDWTETENGYVRADNTGGLVPFAEMDRRIAEAAAAPVVRESLTTEPAAPASQQAGQKQPWEMTQNEYIRSRADSFPSRTLSVTHAAKTREGKAERRAFESRMVELRRAAFASHARAIEQAIDSGKPVERAVIADYKGQPWADAALAKANEATPWVKPDAAPARAQEDIQGDAPARGQEPPAAEEGMLPDELAESRAGAGKGPPEPPKAPPEAVPAPEPAPRKKTPESERVWTALKAQTIGVIDRLAKWMGLEGETSVAKHPKVEPRLREARESAAVVTRLEAEADLILAEAEQAPAVPLLTWLGRTKIDARPGSQMAAEIQALELGPKGQRYFSKKGGRAIDTLVEDAKGNPDSGFHGDTASEFLDQLVSEHYKAEEFRQMKGDYIGRLERGLKNMRPEDAAKTEEFIGQLRQKYADAAESHKAALDAMTPYITNEVSKRGAGAAELKRMAEAHERAVARVKESAAADVAEAKARADKVAATAKADVARAAAVVKEVKAKSAAEVRAAGDKALVSIKEFVAKFKAGKATEVEAKKELIRLANEHLPLEERGKLLKQYMALPTTEKRFETIYNRIADVAYKAERRAAIGEVQDLMAEAKKRLPTMADPHYAAADALLAGVDGTTLSLKQRTALEKAKATLRDTPNYMIPPSLLKRLDRLDRKPLASMTDAELAEFSNDLSSLMHADALSRQVKVGEKMVAYAEATGATEKGITEAGPIMKIRFGMRRAWGVVKSFWSGNLNAHTLLDRMAPGTPLYDVGVTGVRDGVIEQKRHEVEAWHVLQDVRRKLVEMGLDPAKVSAAYQEPGLTHGIREPTPNQTVYKIELPSKQVIELTLDDMADLSGLFRQEKYQLHFLSGEAEFRPWWNQTEKGTVLTQADFLFLREEVNKRAGEIVQPMIDHLNRPEYKKEVFDKAQEVTGRRIPMLPDYWPASRVDITDKVNPLTPYDYGEQFASTVSHPADAGPWKERTGGQRPYIIMGAVRRFHNHTRLMAEIMGRADSVIALSQIMGNRGVRDAMTNHFGVDAVKRMDDYSKGLMRHGGGAKGALDRIFTALSENVQIAQLAGNISSLLRQLTAIPLFLNSRAIDGATFKQTLKEFASDPKAWKAAMARMTENSPWAFSRYVMSGGHQLLNQALDARGWTGRGWREKFMGWISGLDQVASAPAWVTAEKMVAKAEPGLKDSNPKAYWKKVERIFVEAMDDTQQSSDPQVQTGFAMLAKENAALKPSMNYLSQPSQNVNLLTRLWQAYQRAKRTGGDVAGSKAALLKGAAVIGVSTLVLDGMISLAATYFRSGGKNGPTPERMAQMTLSQVTGSFPFVREAADILDPMLFGSRGGSGVGQTPLISQMMQFYDAGGHISSARIALGKDKPAWANVGKAVEHVGFGAAGVFGLPTAPYRDLRGIYRWIDAEEAKPEKVSKPAKVVGGSAVKPQTAEHAGSAWAASGDGPGADSAVGRLKKAGVTYDDARRVLTTEMRRRKIKVSEWFRRLQAFKRAWNRAKAA